VSPPGYQLKISSGRGRFTPRSSAFQSGRQQHLQVEVGGYLDPKGNDFWGVEALVRDGVTCVSGHPTRVERP
jgi:hypothetical protein